MKRQSRFLTLSFYLFFLSSSNITITATRFYFHYFFTWLVSTFAAVFCFCQTSIADVQFKQLWTNHPMIRGNPFPVKMPHGISNSSIKVGEPAFPDQSAARLGIALRRSGVGRKYFQNLATSHFHPKEKMYFLRCQGLALALARNEIPGIGPREVLCRGNCESRWVPQIWGRTGIVFFKDYWREPNCSSRYSSRIGDHIDLWNGYRTTGDSLVTHFFVLSKFPARLIPMFGQYDKADEVWFWEVR